MFKIKKTFQSVLQDRREIYRIHIAHTIRSIALSFITIYAPVYILKLGYSLSEVISFYIIFHCFGLFFTLFVISPLLQKFGLVKIFRFYYPLEIIFYTSLYFMQSWSIPFALVAMIGGAATFVYWVPLNILLVKNSNFDKMGTDLATFFALPKILQVLNPLISLAIVFTVGFWPIFLIALTGLILSYIPLYGVKAYQSKLTLHWKETFAKLSKRKKLFFLESMDNIIEESHWYWSIYVYLLIGSLSVPGILGSLSALGGVLFMLLVGKKSNKNPEKLIIWAAISVILVSLLRIFSEGQFMAYALTLAGSFVMTLFLVPYFSYIYRAIKDKDEEEFIILREIPTVLGRVVVFIFILLTINNPQHFFILPVLVAFLLLVIFILNNRKVLKIN